VLRSPACAANVPLDYRIWERLLTDLRSSLRDMMRLRRLCPPSQRALFPHDYDRTELHGRRQSPDDHDRGIIVSYTKYEVASPRASQACEHDPAHCGRGSGEFARRSDWLEALLLCGLRIRRCSLHQRDGRTTIANIVESSRAYYHLRREGENLESIGYTFTESMTNLFALHKIEDYMH